MYSVEYSCRGIALDADKDGINKTFSAGELKMSNLNITPEYEAELQKYLEEIEEKVVLQASNIHEYYRLMQNEGIPMQNEGDPVKIMSIGESGVVILTNYGTLSTTENLPESIKQEIEAIAIDSPSLMNDIANVLKAHQIDYTQTNSIGYEDHALGEIDVEHENPEASGFRDSASTRKEAKRDILESQLEGTYSQYENSDISKDLTDDEKERLRLEFEKKYGNSTRGKEGREIGE